MSVFVTLFVAEKTSSLLTWCGLYEYRRRKQIQESIGSWDKTGVIRTPFVDRRLKDLAACKSSVAERKLADGVIAFARNVVNRQAFEHLVRGLVYQKSDLRKWLDSKKVKKNAQTTTKNTARL